MKTTEEYRKEKKHLSDWSYYSRKKQQAISEARLFKSAKDSGQFQTTEFSKWTDHFKNIGRKFGLTKEFQKMEII